jgi:hypothetical protein
MSVVVRHHPESLTAEKYDATTAQLEAAGVDWPPDGLDYHVCFGTDGNLLVSEIWDSREQWEAFGEQLFPQLGEAGIEFSKDPDVFEVHEITKR